MDEAPGTDERSSSGELPPQSCLYWSVTLQFARRGGDALLQRCQTGGMAGLVG